MLPSTRTAIVTIWNADPSIGPDQQRDLIAFLDGKPKDSSYLQGDRALTREQVATQLGVTPHTVTVYANRGLIRRLNFGRSGGRASRYSADSVRQLLAGERV